MKDAESRGTEREREMEIPPRNSSVVLRLNSGRAIGCHDYRSSRVRPWANVKEKKKKKNKRWYPSRWRMAVVSSWVWIPLACGLNGYLTKIRGKAGFRNRHESRLHVRRTHAEHIIGRRRAILCVRWLLRVSIGGEKYEDCVLQGDYVFWTLALKSLFTAL